MWNLTQARERSWALFNQTYKDYVNEDQRYLETVRAHLKPGSRVLDAGCGWQLPFARQVAQGAQSVVGVDLGLDGQPEEANVRAVVGDLEALPFADGSFDLVMSRSVLEHLPHPERVFEELSRVLVPGGTFIFLVPNLWDYVSIISWAVPNGLHAAVVEKVLGRDPRDTFPTFYRANTVGDLTRLCASSGLELVEARLLSQYPAYLMFSPALFRLGMAYEQLIRKKNALAFLRSWILGTARRKE